MRSEHPTTGDEYDAFGYWKQFLIYIHRPGVTKGIKRKSHKKDRAQAKRVIQKPEARE